ncbi:TraB/GumN family protein [Candidatus Woesearchaeota archaeon]|nr:TraB/GumN family protein [Candidatus Woesearchaeota archaeon]
MRYKNIILLGTSHISRQSVESIAASVDEKKPDIIAVELDQKRLHALLQPVRPSVSWHSLRRVGLNGTVFALIGSYVQHKLGKLVGLAPGSDMLEAVKLARTRRIRLALIDQDIEVTLSRLSKQLTWREKARFLLDLFRSILFPRQEMKRWGLGQIDLSRVPPQQVIAKLLHYVKKRYPNVHRVLIQERNEVMARNLLLLSHQDQDKLILAMIGAGHEEDMLSIIKKKYHRVEVAGVSASKTF